MYTIRSSLFSLHTEYNNQKLQITSMNYAFYLIIIFVTI